MSTIEVAAKEIAVIRNATDRKRTINEMLDGLIVRTERLNNKELLHGILEEYVKMNRVIDMWWKKMGEKYGFDYKIPHNVDFETRIITRIA